LTRSNPHTRGHKFPNHENLKARNLYFMMYDSTQSWL
jgi:hypothetical protein